MAADDESNERNAYACVYNNNNYGGEQQVLGYARKIKYVVNHREDTFFFFHEQECVYYNWVVRHAAQSISTRYIILYFTTRIIQWYKKLQPHGLNCIVPTYTYAL